MSSSIGQDKSKLQKQISKILMLTETTAGFFLKDKFYKTFIYCIVLSY